MLTIAEDISCILMLIVSGIPVHSEFYSLNNHNHTFEMFWNQPSVDNNGKQGNKQIKLSKCQEKLKFLNRVMLAVKRRKKDKKLTGKIQPSAIKICSRKTICWERFLIVRNAKNNCLCCQFMESSDVESVFSHAM